MQGADPRIFELIKNINISKDDIIENEIKVIGTHNLRIYFKLFIEN